MSDVPSEVLREILLRLPAESLFRFRTVCKAWRRLIDDRSFIKAHTSNQLSSHTLLIRNQTGASLYSFSLDSLNFINGGQPIHATPIKQLIRQGVPRLPDLFEVASCNGLILISHSDIKKIWAIWNPLTRECRELPQPDTETRLMGSGIGYDYASDDYKVVRIGYVCPSREPVCHTHIYSLKSDCWRMIDDCPCNFTWMNGPGVFLNGALHWMSRDTISELDLGTEKYRKLPLPPVPLRPEFCGVHLNALDGCLILSFNHFRMKLFHAWVMKDDEVEKSWTKLFSLELYDADVSWRLRPVVYLKRKRQVLLQNDWVFLWFDLENNSFKKLSIHGLPDITSSLICPGSVVRLNDSGTPIVTLTASARTATGKRQRQSKRTNTRLKLCVRDNLSECCSDNRFCGIDVCWLCEGEDRWDED